MLPCRANQKGNKEIRSKSNDTKVKPQTIPLRNELICNGLIHQKRGQSRMGIIPNNWICTKHQKRRGCVPMD